MYTLQYRWDDFDDVYLSLKMVLVNYKEHHCYIAKPTSLSTVAGVDLEIY